MQCVKVYEYIINIVVSLRLMMVFLAYFFFLLVSLMFDLFFFCFGNFIYSTHSDVFFISIYIFFLCFFFIPLSLNYIAVSMLMRLLVIRDL